MAKSQHKQDIGDRLRLVIEKTHGVERGAHAEWCRQHSVKEQRLSNWINGRSYPDVELMIVLCGLGFTLDWLYRAVPGGVSVDWAEYLRGKSRASPAVSRAAKRQVLEKTSS